MASQHDVERRLEDLIALLAEGDGSVARSLRGSTRVLALEVRDHDAHYWAELDDGTLGPLNRGPAERSEIRLAANSDDLLALMDGRLNLMTAWLTGRVRVDASPGDLLALRSLLG
ncbi:MAG: SCP2 sterol-binding domain-containing protein [Actinomycetota bacterium]|nr:SCP2 sterol-binding domain-containing protein [Actinomycetota bacterium]